MVCDKCNQEMTNKSTKTCLVEPIKFKKKSLAQIPYQDGSRCFDCNVTKGGVHHPGCGRERCPKCHGQIISCRCS